MKVHIKRTIKFRGKSKFDGTWVTGWFVSRVGTEHGIIYGENGTGYDVDIDTVGEFIGLKDKNGLEIFEGDVVRYNGTIWQVGWYGLIAGFTLFTVYEAEEENYVYSSGVPIRDFSWISSKNDKGFYAKGLNLKTMAVDDIEVIGNVYENKENEKQ